MFFYEQVLQVLQVLTAQILHGLQSVNTFGTGKVDDQVIEEFIRQNVDLSPKGIRDKLKLNNPIYVPTTSYGHFGRKPDEILKGSFTWEKTDLVEMLKKEL